MKAVRMSMSSNRKLSIDSVVLIIPLLACTSFAQVPPQSCPAGAVSTICTSTTLPFGMTGQSPNPSNDSSAASLTSLNSQVHELSPGLQAASIRGTVTDANDGPISGAVVTVHG